MTIQRFLYKVFWKKFGVPVIICCGFVALATTLYQHSHFGIVENRATADRNAQRKHVPDGIHIMRDRHKILHEVDQQNEEDNVLRFKSKEERLKLEDIHNNDFVTERVRKDNIEESDSNNENTLRKQEALVHKRKSSEKEDPYAEIDLDDSFFDDLRKPHVHLDGAIAAVEEKTHNANSFIQDQSLQNTKLNSVSGNVKFETVTDTTHIVFNKTKYRDKLAEAMLEYHAQGSKKTDKMIPESVHDFKDNSIDHESFKERLNKLQSDIALEKKALTQNSLGVTEPSKLKLWYNDNEKDDILKVFKEETAKETIFNEEAVYDSSVGVGNEDYIDSFLPKDMPSVTEIAPQRNPGYSYSPLNQPELFKHWQTYSYEACNGKFRAYDNEFTYMKNVIVDKSKFEGRAGGEDIQEVLNQDEKREYYNYDMGCFQMKCSERPQYYFNNGHHLNDFLFNLKTSDVNPKDFDEEIDDFTVVVTRYEYVNLYHTMTDWYNAFLVMNFFNKTQSQTSVLFIDAHPKGGLDSAWSIVFKSAKRLSDLKPKSKFNKMAWSILGYNSLLLRHNDDEIPLTEEFREFFLSSYGISSKRALHCDKLNILFIWRRNYVAHPRNPKGVISRKIRNERALLMATKRHYRDHHVSGVQIDLFDMQQQLKLIAQADVLIGMHGAGLTHAMFLPKHAGLIELVPSYWATMDHFLAIAKWRGLQYERWVNIDPNIEVVDQSTRVPPPIVTSLLRSLLIKMDCSKL